MKFYSELNSKLYDSKEELEKAESAIKEAEAKKKIAEKLKKEERTKRAKEVEEALKAVTAAQTKANKLLKEFTKDYGYFHMSYASKEDEKTPNDYNIVNNLYDLIMNIF
jgi:hypothetical protein